MTTRDSFVWYTDPRRHSSQTETDFDTFQPYYLDLGPFDPQKQRDTWQGQWCPCAKYGSASLIFCYHAIFVVNKLSMESFIYLF